MVSRRNYFSICIMMMVLLFMFQFSQVIKETENKYDVNEYMASEAASGQDRWQGGDLVLTAEELQDGDYVLFLGSVQDKVGQMVSQWCDYTKRNRIVIAGAEELSQVTESLPELLLIDSRAVDFAQETQLLAEMAQKGVPLVFCNLPDVGEIQDNARLKELLGISRVEQKFAVMEGIQLFSGFLLGGEVIYQAKDEEEEKLQDLSLVMPWYVTGSGTKTYMVGIPRENRNLGVNEEYKIEREDYPSVIWRNSWSGTFVFVVNGNYMEDTTALGILDSFVYEIEPYQLYPVINAQSVVVANYPNFSQENLDRLQEIYARRPAALYKDVMWPGIAAVAERNKLKLTCYLSPQYYYTDWIEPSSEDVVFYLQQLKEIGAEAGRTLEYAGDVTLEEKLARDNEFFSVLDGKYRFGTYYAGEDISVELDALLKTDSMEDIRTVVVGDGAEYPLVSYYTDSVTLQRTTAEAAEYTYSGDLRMKSVETALAYSNVVMNLYNVTWPESQEDQWEKYFDKVSSNIYSYWKGYRSFAYTSLSESDAHVRSFLNLRYEETREGDTIILQVKNAGEEAWFALRTHGEAIVGMEGGDYTEVEEGYYLLHVLSDRVEIQVEDASHRLGSSF